LEAGFKANFIEIAVAHVVGFVSEIRKARAVARPNPAAAGRGERIRTSGLYVPNVALYQAKLHPDVPEDEGPALCTNWTKNACP
jgi:hypothetical protein